MIWWEANYDVRWRIRTGVGKSEGAVSICIRESFRQILYLNAAIIKCWWKKRIGIEKWKRGSADKNSVSMHIGPCI